MSAEPDPDLEPDMPTFEELTATASRCIVCHSTLVRIDSPAMRWVLLIGGAMSLWVLYRGAIGAAIMMLMATVTLAAGVKVRFHYRKCEMCGHEWHRSKQLID